jgi:PII-like signaling protein
MDTMVMLRIYAEEAQRHHGKLLYEWLLEEARALGFSGGSVFRAIAGYGRHGVRHDAGFFELAGALPVVVTFVTRDALADALLAKLADAGLKLFYARTLAQCGVTGE